MKISAFLFLLFGLVLGAAIFWLPTSMGNGASFGMPMLPWSPWYFLAIPYLAIFALVYGMLVGIYRLLKKSFSISSVDVLWIMIGLYLSLTFLFRFIDMAASVGKLTI